MTDDYYGGHAEELTAPEDGAPSDDEIFINKKSDPPENISDDELFIAPQTSAASPIPTRTYNKPRVRLYVMHISYNRRYEIFNLIWPQIS